LEEDKDDDDDEEDSGALCHLDFGGGGGGGEGASDEGGSSGSSGSICEAHLENLSSLAPDVSPSPSSLMVSGLLVSLLNHSDCSFNLLSMASSASFIWSFIHCKKIAFSFWYALSLCSLLTCAEKGLA
jgi:hypothetical protein